MSNRFRVAACALLLTASSFAGTIIHVPANQPTIQAGINAASNGDTVLVAPGIYYENINFNGKAITLASSNGAKVTVINGGAVATVVTFSSHETTSSVLKGFTITNGYRTGLLVPRHSECNQDFSTVSHEIQCGSNGLSGIFEQTASRWSVPLY